MIGYIRELISGLYGQETAAAVRIQYGGSVKPNNIAEYMQQPNIDGAWWAVRAWSRHLTSRWLRGLSKMARPKPVALIILDGFGLRSEVQGNAVAQAKKPNYDRYWNQFPHTTLTACGEAVGLPEGQMGNSEVGHLNIGAAGLCIRI